jgi:hypothetical protein
MIFENIECITTGNIPEKIALKLPILPLRPWLLKAYYITLADRAFTLKAF